ncbi:MAG: hypothetical protein ACE5E6_11285, partial [Phycisphaerae bacterium]
MLRRNPSMSRGRRTRRRCTLVGGLAVCCAWPLASVFAAPAADAVPASATPEGSPKSSGADAPRLSLSSVVEAIAGDTGDLGVRPRLTLQVPSLHTLVSEMRRARSGVLVDRAARLLLEAGADAAEGFDAADAAALLQRFKDMPDTGITVTLYASDTEGRYRWLVRTDWP